MRKVIQFFLFASLQVLMASYAFAEGDVACAVTVDYQQRAHVASSRAVTVDVCVRSAIQDGCVSHCPQQGTRHVTCVSACVSKARLSVSSCQLADGKACTANVEDSRRALLGSGRLGTTDVKLISSRQAKKRGKKAGYLIEAPRTSKRSPTLIDPTKYVHQKRGTGTGKLLQVSSKPANTDKSDRMKKSSEASKRTQKPSASKKKKSSLLK